jgi:hypothetical protein
VEDAGATGYSSRFLSMAYAWASPLYDLVVWWGFRAMLARERQLSITGVDLGAAGGRVLAIEHGRHAGSGRDRRVAPDQPSWTRAAGVSKKGAVS